MTGTRGRKLVGEDLIPAEIGDWFPSGPSKGRGWVEWRVRSVEMEHFVVSDRREILLGRSPFFLPLIFNCTFFFLKKVNSNFSCCEGVIFF